MKGPHIAAFWKLLFPLLASSLSFAVQPDRVTGPIDSSQMVTLPGHVHRNAKPQYDQGPVEASFPLSHVTLLTLPSASQQQALSLLVAEQQDPSSANYHKWLTPEQYADRFGLSQNDVQKISAWLSSQGLSVVSVARGRNWMVFSGTAAQIESAFRTEIHHYNVNGEAHFANATPPSIPAALASIVTGVRGLDDFHPKPRNVRKAAPQSQNPRPDYSDSNFNPPDFLAPGDIATIYDLTPLYGSGIDGTGQKLAVVGQTDVYLSDLNNFRTGFGLTQITGCTTNSPGVITACNTSNFRYVLDGPDPGVSTSGDLGESDLDLEWSAAIARGAQIIFVNSTDVGTSYYYAIDNDLAPVISMSYGACEFEDNTLDADEAELTKANSFGITFINSTGDTGAAECDNSTNSATNNLAVYGLAVSYPASSPEVTGVGGTAIPYPGGFASTYWGTTNSTEGGTALSYDPEIAYNDDVELALPAFLGGTALSVQENPDVGIDSGGGGPSNCSTQTANFSSCVTGFPQPSWQTVTIPGQASFRFTPDVSLLASPNFPGYIFCTQLSELGDSGSGSSCGSGGAAGIASALTLTDPSGNPTPSVVGGTSASAQVFAGMVTLLNQYLGGTGLGNINPMLYKLAATPSNNAFHQVTSGNNVVYCKPDTPTDMPASYQCPSGPSPESFGYSASNADATTGYNLVTGLGSVDVNKLAVAWAAATQAESFTVAGSATTVTAGNSEASTITVTPSGGFTGQVAVTCPAASLPPGVTCTLVNINVPPGTGQLTVSVEGASTPGATAQALPTTKTEYASLQGGPTGRSGWWKLSAGTGLAAIFLIFVPGRRRYRSAMGLWLVCLLSFAMGCGSSSGSSGGDTEAAATTTTIKAPVTKAGLGTLLSFPVAVTAAGMPAGNGMVQLFDGATALGAPMQAVNGAVTISNNTLIVGTHAISAHYLGDANTLPSQSGVVFVTVTGTVQLPISAVAGSVASNGAISLTIN